MGPAFIFQDVAKIKLVDYKSECILRSRRRSRLEFAQFEDMERKYFCEDWDWNTMIKFLVLCCPKSMIGTVEAESEKFSDEFSREQNALFAREHGPDGDIFDDGNGGYLFTTPIGKKVTRVLNRDAHPKYSELRARVLRAIVGVGSESVIEKRIREG